MTGVRGRDHPGRVDLDAFVRDGYVTIRGAVDADTVAACRELTWSALERRGVRRDDPDGFVLDDSDPSPVAQAIIKGLAMPD
jgi:hypothetical protein